MSIYLLGKFSLSRAGCARVIVMRLRRDKQTIIVLILTVYTLAPQEREVITYTRN